MTNRILIAIISIIASVGLYLSLRVLKKHNISTRIQNWIMFIPTTFIFLIIVLKNWSNLWVWRNHVLLMIPVCILFSWLPSLASLESMKKASNIGYSLIISKSYVIITAILAIPLFNAIFTYIDALAITLVVWFSSLILIDPNAKDINSNATNSRIYYAFYACIWRAGLALSSKRFSIHWIQPDVLNFWIFWIVSVITIFEAKISWEAMIPSRKIITPALGVVLAMVIFNRSLQVGYKIAPNPGYISAANTSSIAFLTLISAWIFHDPLSLRKIIGIFWVILWIMILFLF